MANSGVTRICVLERGVLHAMRHSNVKSECQLKQIKMRSVGTWGRFDFPVMLNTALQSWQIFRPHCHFPCASTLAIKPALYQGGSERISARHLEIFRQLVAISPPTLDHDMIKSRSASLPVGKDS